MELTQEEQELIIKVAEEKGYKYFFKDKYYWKDIKTTSEKKILELLKFPDSLKIEGLYRVVSHYEELKTDVLSTLRMLKGSVKELDTSSEIIDGDRSNQSFTEMLKKFALFKTPLKDLIKDPGAIRSGGLSIICINKDTRHIVDHNKVNIDGMLSSLGISREEVVMREDIPMIYPKFNPYTADITYETKWDLLGGESNMLALNTAIPPRWMKDVKEGKCDVEPKIGNFIQRLITHLFPLDHERELVLDWCHYAVFKRNGTVLCLAGDRGTGKSLFIEILSHLVGVDYSEIVNEAVLEEKFNAQFFNKRLIIFEEVALNTKLAISKVKAWCNSKINIEQKGNDSFTAHNWSSMVFLMNDIADLQVNAQERRFSIPRVAEQSLLNVISEKEISDFKIWLEEGDMRAHSQIAEFGLFLKSRKPKFNEQIALKGDYFFKVADTTMAEWQYTLREYIINNGEVGKIIQVSDIFPDSKNMIVPKKRSTIDAFLSDFRHMGMYKIAQTVDLPSDMSADKKQTALAMPASKRTRRTYGILPREEFLKKYGLKYKFKAEDIL